MSISSRVSKPNNHLSVPPTLSFFVTRAASPRRTSLLTFCQGQIGWKRPGDRYCYFLFPIWMMHSCAATLCSHQSRGIILSDVYLPTCSDVFMGERRMDVAFLDDRTSEGSKAEPPGHWHVYLFLYPEDES